MPRGGRRPGAGRKPGSVSKTTAIKQAVGTLATNEAESAPFKDAEGFLMALLNDPDAPLVERSRAAIALLPFQKAKLGEIAPGKKGAAKERAEAAAEPGKRFAPAAPPKLAIDNTKD